tara:strand:+ start:232 stop:753 length:522 start_codon:yes stop_codon:yes gene_type:complete
MTIENTINNFSTNIGNAVTLGKHFLTIVDHVVEKRDTTSIVKIHNAAINRNDKDIASAIRFTFGKIYIGAKIKTDPKTKKALSIQIKDAKLSNSAIKALSDVAGSISMRGTNWKNAFKTDSEKNTTKEIDVQKRASNFAQKHPELLEQKIAETAALLAALQAQRATVSKKKAA